MNIEKMTFGELKRNKNWKDAVIVFKQESFTTPYTEKERSYEISSDAKYLDGNKLGTSLFGDCLDGKDLGVRLDKYMDYEGWLVDYCYVTKWKEEGI